MTQRPPPSNTGPSTSAPNATRAPVATAARASTAAPPSTPNVATRTNPSDKAPKSSSPSTRRSPNDGVRTLTMSTDDRASLLENSRWFQSVAFTHVRGLAEFLTPISVAPGTYIFEEGDADVYMGIVVSGAIEIVKADKTDELKSLGSVGPGRSFGEMSLIDGAPRSASAFAKSASMVLVLSKASFLRLLDERPNLGVQLLLALCKITSQRLRQTSGRLVDFLES